MSTKSYKRACGQSKRSYYNGLSLSLHKRVSYSFLSLRIYKPTHTDTHTNIHKYTYVCKITGLYMKCNIGMKRLTL